MDPQAKDYIVSRIRAGHVLIEFCGKQYIIREPSNTIKYRANIIYNQFCKETSSIPHLTREDIYFKLMDKNLWSIELEQELTTCVENIDKLKIGIYESQLRSHDRNVAKKALDATRNRHLELLVQKNIYDYLSIEYIQEHYKKCYLLYFSLCDMDCQFIHTSLSNSDFVFTNLDLLLDMYYRELCTEKEYREISRTDPWMTLWGCAEHEHSLFGIPAADYSFEQRTLCAWSRYYSNIASLSDRPTNAVIEDDDALDGWALLRYKKQIQSENQQLVDDILSNPKLQNADQVYVKVQSQEDAKIVNDLNSPVAKLIKKQRKAVLDKHGSISEFDMPDMQQRKMSELNQKFIQTVKG